MTIEDPLSNSEPDEDYEYEAGFGITIGEQTIYVPIEQYKEKTGLALKSLLLIHETLKDAESLEGYEATPEQVTMIYYGVWAVLTRNPDLIEPEEIQEKWLEDFIDGYKERKQKLKLESTWRLN
jgi:hypothetical protein